MRVATPARDTLSSLPGSGAIKPIQLAAIEAKRIRRVGLERDEGIRHEISSPALRPTGHLKDFWSDHPQANRLGSLLTIGHVNSDALGLC